MPTEKQPLKARESKREVFIVADDGWRLESEAELLDFLRTEQMELLRLHPGIDNAVFRALFRAAGTKTERMAVQVFDRLHALLDALNQPNTPVWKAAALGIKCQDRVMIYRQPGTSEATGRAYAKDKQPRQGRSDELTMRVMKYLRQERNLTWKEAIREMEGAVCNERQVARVDIERSGDTWIFKKKQPKGAPEKVEKFKTSTLQKYKFHKAR